MIFSEPLTQGLSPQDYLPPQTVNNTTVNTNGIDMSKFTRARYEVQAGVIGASGVLQVIAQSSPLPNFSPAHNLANCSITNINTSNTVVQFEIRGDQIIYQNAGDRYLRLQLVGSGNSLTVGVLGDGGMAPQGPAAQYNNTTVVTQTVLCST